MANTSRLKATLKGEVSFPVYYEDTDFSEYVYHANYLKYFERAREHLIGIQSIKKLFDEGIHYVVGEIHVRFRAPARHADNVIIRSETVATTSPLLIVKQDALRRELSGKETLLCSATVKIVAIGSDGHPINIPDQYILEYMNVS